MKKKTKRLTLTEKNAAFNKLTKAEKRTQIAKDVLNQLRSKKLLAKSGVYANSDMLSSLEYDFEFKNEFINKDLKDLLDKEKSCTVCGIGSLFVCTVKRLDKLKISELIHGHNFYGISQDHVHDYLSKYFTHFELAKIESAFEMGNFSDVPNDNKPFSNFQLKSIEKAAEYFKTYPGRKLSATERMEIIMKNIIDNGGAFKIPDIRYGLKPSTLKK